MVMVFLISPLGLIGVVPTLILFQQPFGINALVGLIALSGRSATTNRPVWNRSGR